MIGRDVIRRDKGELVRDMEIKRTCGLVAIAAVA
jgi:hypothetical protein